MFVATFINTLLIPAGMSRRTGRLSDYAKYKKRFEKAGLVVDTTSLAKTHRCSETVCRFMREHLGIEIYSHSTNLTDVILLDQQGDADRFHACEKTVKLFLPRTSQVWVLF